MIKVMRYKDIVLPNLKKTYKTEAEVLDDLNVEVLSIEAYVAHPTIGAYPRSIPKELLQKGYYFEDSDDVIFASYNLFAKQVSLTSKLSLGLDIGTFYVQEKNRSKRQGYQYGLSVYYDKWTVRLGRNSYNNFNEYVPTVRYKGTYGRHGYQFEYTYQNALFYVFREKTLNDRIKAHHFNLSDYVTWRDKTSLWSNIEVNNYSNNDTEIVTQYDWRFLYHKVAHTALTYDLAFEGWYSTHSKETNDFYSPKFADTTVLRTDLIYRFSKYMSLRAYAGVGYSFYDKYIPYKYGIHIFSNEIDQLHYDVGCLYSNSLRAASNTNYHYMECDFSLGYTW